MFIRFTYLAVVGKQCKICVISFNINLSNSRWFVYFCKGSNCTEIATGKYFLSVGLLRYNKETRKLKSHQVKDTVFLQFFGIFIIFLDFL